MDTRTWILWDGDCGFCRRAIAWMMRHDRQGRFQAVQYQQAPTPPMTPALHAACEHAVHVVMPDGRILRAGRATLHILSTVGYGWIARPLMLPPFIWLVELLYRIVASNRSFLSRFFFKSDT